MSVIAVQQMLIQPSTPFWFLSLQVRLPEGCSGAEKQRSVPVLWQEDSDTSSSKLLQWFVADQYIFSLEDPECSMFSRPLHDLHRTTYVSPGISQNIQILVSNLLPPLSASNVTCGCRLEEDTDSWSSSMATFSYWRFWSWACNKGDQYTAH